MQGFLTVILVLVGLAAVGFGVWAYLRHRYVQSLRDKGWQFITSPGINIVHGLNVPPFGIGFARAVDDQILGNASDGTPFSAFEYTCSGWRGAGYVVAVPLPSSLPPAEIFAGPSSPLPLAGHAVTAGQVTAVAQERGYAEELLSAVGPVLDGPFRVSVDHGVLTLVNAPKDADPLQNTVELLARVRSALVASPAAQRQGPPPPQGLSFYGREHWVYVPRDDSYLGLIGHTGGGYGHEASDIVYSDNGGLPFLRLRHDWKTTHTRRDSDGNTHTETRHHTEYLCSFRTTFPFGDLAVNWGWFGRSQRFEWEAFNDQFRIEAPDTRFASDVLHQRQMEYLMAVRAPKFVIESGTIMFGEGGQWMPEDIDNASQFLHGFFARVPDFVWQSLGAWPRPIPELDAA